MVNPEKMATSCTKNEEKQNKAQHNTICAGHHYLQTNTNNVNKTLAPPTIKRRQRRTEHRFHAEIVTDIPPWNSERKDTNRTTQTKTEQHEQTYVHF